MKNVINPPIHKDEVRDVILDEPELRMLEQMGDVGESTGDEIIKTNDGMPLRNQSITQMGTEKASSASDKDSFFRQISHDRVINVNRL